MSHVLLLNASLEPLGVITQRRALSLMYRGRVEAVTDESFELRGVTKVFSVPSVIRLRRFINVPRRGAKWSRRGVLQRDNFTCAYCGVKAGERQNKKYMERSDFTVDHILPTSRGGKNTWVNTVCACPSCNHRKGNRTPHEANIKLLWEPKTPRVSYLVASGDIPAAWKVYMEW